MYSVQLLPSAGQAGITLIIELAQGWVFQSVVCEAIVEFPKQPSTSSLQKKLQTVLLLPLLEMHFWTPILVLKFCIFEKNVMLSFRNFSPVRPTYGWVHVKGSSRFS